MPHHNIIKFDVTDSTNIQAKRLVEQMKGESFIVTTGEQTNGKGQQNNVWHSKKNKNLIFSLVVHPSFIKADNQFFLNKIVSLSIKNFLSKYLKKDIKIKWPNDIYVDDKKIAGVLIEHSICNNIIYYSIIGIGINVNQTHFPEDIPNPVSVKNITAKDYDLNEMLKAFLKSFDELYLPNKTQIIEHINDDYLGSLYLLNTETSFLHNGKIINASIKSIDKYGRLIIYDRYNKETVCGFNEIKYIRQN